MGSGLGSRNALRAQVIIIQMILSTYTDEHETSAQDFKISHARVQYSRRVYTDMCPCQGPARRLKEDLTK